MLQAKFTNSPITFNVHSCTCAQTRTRSQQAGPAVLLLGAAAAGRGSVRGGKGSHWSCWGTFQTEVLAVWLNGAASWVLIKSWSKHKRHLTAFIPERWTRGVIKIKEIQNNPSGMFGTKNGKITGCGLVWRWRKADNKLIHFFSGISETTYIIASYSALICFLIILGPSNLVLHWHHKWEISK